MSQTMLERMDGGLAAMTRDQLKVTLHEVLEHELKKTESLEYLVKVWRNRLLMIAPPSIIVAIIGFLITSYCSAVALISTEPPELRHPPW